MALITLCISLILFCVACGAVGSFFVFLFDVIKWHNQEKRTKISASAQKLPKIFDEFDERSDLSGRNDNSDSGNNGTNSNGADCGNCDGDSDRDSGSISVTGAESSKRDASVIFDSWLQPGPRAD